MQNKEHKMDELFRSKLSAFEVTPPPAVWDRISDSLGHSRRKRKAMFIWSMSGAASLLLAFLMGWYLSGTRSDSSELMSELKEVRKELGNSVILSSNVDQQVSIHFNSPKINSINESFIAVLLAEKEKSESASVQEDNMQLMVSIAPLNIENSVMFPALIHSNTEFFTKADKAIFEANLLAMNIAKNDDQSSDAGWAVGVQASPVYRFDQLQLGQKDYVYAAAPDAVQNKSTTSYNSNVSGGVSVAYNANRRLAFISGLNYNEVSQTSGGVALTYAGHNWLNDRNSIGFDSDYYSDKGSEEVAGAVNNASNNLVMNTQIGLANINLPAGTEVASAKSMSSLASEVAQNYDFKQNARYLEIPMLLRYRFIEKRLGLHVLGGINTNVLVDNSVRLQSQNEILANGKVEGLRSVTLSSSLGMGMNYEITSHVNFSLEPTFKIQLNSLNSQQYVNARPYGFGVFSGLSYRF